MHSFEKFCLTWWGFSCAESVPTMWCKLNCRNALVDGAFELAIIYLCQVKIETSEKSVKYAQS